MDLNISEDTVIRGAIAVAIGGAVAGWLIALFGRTGVLPLVGGLLAASGVWIYDVVTTEASRGGNS